MARRCERRELLRGVVSAAITVCDIAPIPGSHDFEWFVRSRFSRQPYSGDSTRVNEEFNEIHVFITHNIPVHPEENLRRLRVTGEQIQPWHRGRTTSG